MSQSCDRVSTVPGSLLPQCLFSPSPTSCCLGAAEKDVPVLPKFKAALVSVSLADFADVYSASFANLQCLSEFVTIGALPTLCTARIIMILEALKALLIGVVEGITEWLPISSTGHMILVDEFVHFNVSEAFMNLFLVVIQIGAILAVLILYFHKLNPFSPRKDAEEKRSTWRLWGMVVIGCIPAAIIGLLFDDWVNEHFYNKVTVAAMLILYGVIFIVIERRNRKKLACAVADHSQLRGKHAKPTPSITDGDSEDEALADMFSVRTVDDIDWKTALKIGCFQVLAIIPGTSRSGATIIGGMLCGCSRTAAAEFTFFLAIPVMLGWGLVKVIKFVLAGIAMTSTEILVLIVGIVTAFVMSVVAIRFLMGYIKNNDFTVFGWYRIVIGVLVLGYFFLEMQGILP